MNTAKRQLGSALVAALIVLFGVVLWVDSYSLLDPDSYVFPRVMIIGMAITGSLVVIRDLWKARASEDYPPGDAVRRILLIVLMLATAGAIPFIGMGLGLVLLMLGAIELSRFEPWSARQRLLLHGIGIAIAVGLTVVFRELLYVPLPMGSWWG